MIEAKAAIRALAVRLSVSEAEKENLAFANDELSATLAVLEEEKAASTKGRDDSMKILELTLEAEQSEAAKVCFGKKNAILAAIVTDEQRKNCALCAEVELLKESSRNDSRKIVELTRQAKELEAANTDAGRENAALAAIVSQEQLKNHLLQSEVALLKATLAERSNAEAPKPEDGCKATRSSTFVAAASQATSTTAETPRNAPRRPLATVDPKPEMKCGNGGMSTPTLTYQTTLRDCQGQCTPVSKPAFPSAAGPDSLRCKVEVSPSIVYSPLSVVSSDRRCSLTTPSLKVEGPVQNNASTSHDYKNKTTSPPVENPVQQTAPAPRRYSARVAAKARQDSIAAAKANRDSIATRRGSVVTRRSKRVEDESPLSSLRVTRSSSRAAEKAATAADKR